MPVHPEPTALPPPGQLAALREDAWQAEIVPLLPADLAAQARAPGAFRRVRKVATPTNLLRALLTGALDQLSTRGLGTWTLLAGMAELSEAAWRRRLGKSAAWLSWPLVRLLWARQGRVRRPVPQWVYARAVGYGVGGFRTAPPRANAPPPPR